MASQASAKLVQKRSAKLLRGFDRKAASWKRALGGRLGEDAAASVMPEARTAYKAMLDEIPYAGRRDIMAGSIIACYQLLAFYKVLKARGVPLEEIGAFFDEASEMPLQWVPRWLMRPLLRTGSRALRPLMRRAARASQERQDPDEFIWEFVDGDGGDTDFGINIKSCAVCRMASKHDAMEAVPFMCALDDKMSEAFGLGLRRSGTIALGATHCDFRYKLGGPQRTLREQYSLAQRRRLEL